MTRLILFDPIIVRVANKGGSKVMLNKNKKCVANRDALIAERAPAHTLSNPGARSSVHPSMPINSN
jgi:hypothetical protein